VNHDEDLWSQEDPTSVGGRARLPLLGERAGVRGTKAQEHPLLAK